MMKQKQAFWIVMLAMLTGSAWAQTDGSDFITTAPSVAPYDAPQQQAPGTFLHTSRGNFMIGTGIGFSTSDSEVDVNSPDGKFSGDGGSSTQLNFSPGIGYFFANNFAFGVGMEVIASRTTSQTDITNPNSPEQRSESSNLLFGPFARYYLGVSDDKAFFLGTTLGFGSSRDQFTSTTGSSQTINNNIVTVGVGPGFTVFSNSGFALEALVKYNFANSNSDINLDGITRESNTRTHAFDFSVGVQYYFGGLRRIDQTETTPTPGRF
ncbi:MAG: outer membrane beta-barrel protein [Saprospiraceae bacterium]